MVEPKGDAGTKKPGCGCDHFRVGYNGQLYEVLYTDHDDVEHIFGWQNEPEGGLLDAVKLWPSAKSGRIVEVNR